MTNLASWCDTYSWVILSLGLLFILGALTTAWVETLALIRAKRAAAAEAERAAVERPAAEPDALANAVDPVDLLEALQGVLEAIKGLPAWVAIFLAGLALLWLGSDLPKACVCPSNTDQCAPDDEEGEEESDNSAGAENKS